MFVMTVNAGAIPPEHWTHDPVVGGGRIVGEACHFIDLLSLPGRFGDYRISCDLDRQFIWYGRYRRQGQHYPAF